MLRREEMEEVLRYISNVLSKAERKSPEDRDTILVIAMELAEGMKRYFYPRINLRRFLRNSLPWADPEGIEECKQAIIREIKGEEW